MNILEITAFFSLLFCLLSGSYLIVSYVFDNYIKFLFSIIDNLIHYINSIESKEYAKHFDKILDCDNSNDMLELSKTYFGEIVTNKPLREVLLPLAKQERPSFLEIIKTCLFLYKGVNTNNIDKAFNKLYTPHETLQNLIK